MDAPTIFSHKPTLRGKKVVLRPFTEADIEAMGPILADPEVLRLTGSVSTSDAAAGEQPTLDDRSLRWYSTRAEQRDRLDLAIVDGLTDRCVGEIVLNEWSPENERCNLRILIGPDGRDRGFGTEAIMLLLDYAFTQTDLYRIELEVYRFNPRAQHVYAKAGFVEEGRRRAAMRFDGERIDAILMAALRPEWLAKQGDHDVRC